VVYNASIVGVELRCDTGNEMSESRNAQTMLAEAERAARSGDLATAEELLRNAAELQETELGPLHPDLANTLNNLAIVAEKTGRKDDAETFYRRAVEIASASLPPDDPMVTASRQNLEEFCRAQGLPIDRPVLIEPAAAEMAAPPAPTASPPAPPPPSASSASTRALPALAVGAIVLLIAAFFIARPRPREPSTTPPAAEAPSLPPAVERSQPTSGVVAPTEAAPPPTAKNAPAAAAMALVTVRLCRTFSPSDFRCSPAGDSVPPGPIVLFTRVRSPRDSVIIHRWFRGDTLRKSAQLRVGANGAEGYRTYSRQTVDRGDWRVEVRTAEGDLLHEQHLAVR
jgi:hypothetical protein